MENTKEQRIKNIFTDLLGVDNSEITPQTTNNDLQMDSLDKVEVLMKIEMDFNVEITDEEAGRCKQFSDYVQLVEEKLK